MKAVCCAFCCALAVHLTAGDAAAQTFHDLQIELRPYSLSDNGGERPRGVSLTTGPVTIGRLVASTFSVGEACDAFTVSSGRGDVRENATFAWTIEVTPIRVVDEAVTFRLRWTRLASIRTQIERNSDVNGSARNPGEDVELTLRPGESWPVDSVPMPAGAKMVDGRACRGNSATIRVLVDRYPSANSDRRLVVADLWLVERLPNGQEAQRGPVLSVRGLPNRAIPFYFDSVGDGTAWLDIYGILRARPANDTMAVALDTRSAWGSTASERFSGPQRSLKSDVDVKSEEVVDIQLPKLGDGGGPFAARQFAIRIRIRQLR